MVIELPGSAWEPGYFWKGSGERKDRSFGLNKDSASSLGRFFLPKYEVIKPSFLCLSGTSFLGWRFPDWEHMPSDPISKHNPIWLARGGAKLWELVWIKWNMIFKFFLSRSNKSPCRIHRDFSKTMCMSTYSKGAVIGIAWGRYPDGYLSSKVCCWDLLVT